MAAWLYEVATKGEARPGSNVNDKFGRYLRAL